MKNTLILFILAAAFYQAKAQQTFSVNPSDSLKTNRFNQYFKTMPDLRLPLLQQPLNGNTFINNLTNHNTINKTDHMPIAFLQGHSKMPVAMVNGDDNKMVLKLREDNVTEVAPILKTP